MDARIDLRVLVQIFLDEVYGGLNFADRVVVDIGAHKGYFAAYALLCGARAVLCFEPAPKNFAALSRFARTAANNRRCVKIHQEAAGQEGETTLYVTEESWSHTTLYRPSQAVRSSLKVISRSLTGILAEAREQFPQNELLLKIDAEGAECSLLLDTPQGCFAQVKEIIFEFHNFSGCSLDAILDRLRSFGFESVGSVREADLHHLSCRSAT